MINITFPDGKILSFQQENLNGLNIAEKISHSMKKKAIAMEVNGKLIDIKSQIKTNAKVSIITSNSSEGLEIIRHDAAHVLAEAVKEIYPETQVTIGPVIENGFYYDFYRESPFTLEDLKIIEKRMKQIVDRNEEITREIWDRDQAIDYFLSIGEKYKAIIIKDLPSDETISIYRQGSFLDLCRGPHLPSTGKLGKSFKLLRLAGAYWRGDSNNAVLQRIYGTAWSNDKELDDHLNFLEEASKRDHRKLGKKFNLFHLQEEAPGMIFWHPKGWAIYREIESYIRNIQNLNGYQEIKTPQVVDRVLWEKSGHWDKFQENMFTIHSEEREYAIKPMNCPCHVQIFNQRLHSYRELPIRLAEFGSCHRNEPSGTLQGIMRIRGFSQDDAHIFCTESQIQSEVSSFIKILYQVYKDFGFDQIIVHLSTRPEDRVGSDEIWDKAEKSLEEALNKNNIDWNLQLGEGAFYGPKIEFSLKDCLNRVWQCGTIQVDFSMPERLGAKYIAQDNSRKTPVMLHRAILGSFERFLGVLIEEHKGSFPIWLAPVQVAILTVNESSIQYAHQIEKMLKINNIRIYLDIRDEKIGYKIREHAEQKIPIIVILGQKEVEEKKVSIRLRGDTSGKNIKLDIDKLVVLLKENIKDKVVNLAL